MPTQYIRERVYGRTGSSYIDVASASGKGYSFSEPNMGGRVEIKNVDDNGKMGIIEARGDVINNTIEARHPVEIASAFSARELDSRQQGILDKLPGYGSQTIVNKRDVSMLDLSAMTAKTGDEFAMFTRKGERLIVRGDSTQVPLNRTDIINLRNNGYRWSGHTHPGVTDADLIVSSGDRMVLELFGQDRSVVYNAAGRHSPFRKV